MRTVPRPTYLDGGSRRQVGILDNLSEHSNDTNREIIRVDNGNGEGHEVGYVPPPLLSISTPSLYRNISRLVISSSYQLTSHFITHSPAQHSTIQHMLLLLTHLNS